MIDISYTQKRVDELEAQVESVDNALSDLEADYVAYSTQMEETLGLIIERLLKLEYQK